MKCEGCAADVLDLFNFCHKCGKSLSNTQAQGKSTSTEVTSRPQTFQQFRKRLSAQRQQKKVETGIKKKKPESESPNEVLINIGVLKLTKGVLKPCKGKVMIVRVPTNIRKLDLLRKGIEKHAAYDKHFDPHEGYTLAFPDGSEVLTIPGQPTQIFQLDKYKEDIGKSYNRLTLYLVERALLERKDSDEDSEGSDSDDLQVSLTASTSTCTLTSSSSKTANGDLNKHNVSPTDSDEEELSTGIFDDKPSTSGTCKLISDNASTSTSTCTNGNEPKMRCPICNVQLPMSQIEQHADACLTSRETHFLCMLDSIDVPDDDEDDKDQPEEQSSIPTDKEELTSLLISAIRTASVDRSDAEVFELQINVRRGFAFADFKNHFNKSWNKKKWARPYRIKFIGEAGSDTGGVSREFYTEALSEVKSQFFSGTDATGYIPSCGIVSIADGMLHAIGHLFAASLCNGGPGPGFLAPWVYNYIIGGMGKVIYDLPSDLPTGSVFHSIYKKLMAAEDDEEVVKSLNSDEALSMLEDVGYRGDPSKAKVKNKLSVLHEGATGFMFCFKLVSGIKWLLVILCSNVFWQKFMYVLGYDYGQNLKRGTRNYTSFASLYGGASYKKVQYNVSAALNLPGTAGSYATTPAVAIQSTSLTIAFWVKLYSSNSYYLYSYWLNPYIFNIGVRKASEKVTIIYQSRKKSNTDLFIARGGGFHRKFRFSKDSLESDVKPELYDNIGQVRYHKEARKRVEASSERPVAFESPLTTTILPGIGTCSELEGETVPWVFD
ncbi:hypothetical protein QZH41_000911, partial [Actinostola sp. cb2023]